MTQLSPQDISKLQKLTNLTVSASEQEELLGSVDNIIGLLEQLNNIDTTDIEPLTHPISGHTIDLEHVVPTNCDNPQDYLANVQHRMINNAIKIKSMLS